MKKDIFKRTGTKTLQNQINDLKKEISDLKKINCNFSTQNIDHEDKIQKCIKCGARLGIYDEKTNELRIRYRDFFAWWKGSKDSYLKIVCRSCSYLNEIRYNKD